MPARSPLDIESSAAAERVSSSAADVDRASLLRLSMRGTVYELADAKAKFVADFVAAWVKVMNLDRFDRA